MSKTVGSIFALATLGCVGFILFLAVDTKTEDPLVQKGEIPVSASSRGLTTQDRYADEQSCAQCHPGETAHHAKSGHSSTLRPTSSIQNLDSFIGKSFPDPDYPEAEWRLERSDKGLEFVRESGGKVEHDPLEFGFGSGHHGITFVSITNEVDAGYPKGIEHRFSYFAKADGFTVTPGQGKGSRLPGRTAHGRELDSAEIKKCFDCHSVFLSDRGANRMDRDQLIPTVGCQSCHGPAADHVAAAQQENADLESLLMAPFGHERAHADVELEACGQCHRHPSQFKPQQLDVRNYELIRFQPVGLAMSRCFRESGRKLQCTSCHDPHDRVSHDIASYEQVCLSCHQSGTPHSEPASIPASASASTCKFSAPPPSQGCVGCHMPKGDAGQEIIFTNHWIQVPPDLPNAKAAAE